MDKNFFIGAALAAPKSTVSRRAIVRNDVVLPQANIGRHAEIPSKPFFNLTSSIAEFADDSYYSTDLNEEASYLDRMVLPDTNMESFLKDDMVAANFIGQDSDDSLFASLAPVVIDQTDDSQLASPSDMSMIHPQPAYGKADEELDAHGLLFPDIDEAMVDLSVMAAVEVQSPREEKKPFVPTVGVDVFGLEVKLVEPISAECPVDDIPVLTEEDLKALEFENYKPIELQGVDFLQRVVAESEILVEPLPENRSHQRASLKERTLSIISGTCTVEDMPPSCVSYDSSAYYESGSDSSPSAIASSPTTGARKSKSAKTTTRKRQQLDDEERAQRKRDQNAAAAFRYRLKKKDEIKRHMQALSVLKTRNKDLRAELKKLIDKFEGARELALSLL